MRWDAKPQRNALTGIHVPFPVGGINTAEPGGAMPASDAVIAVNVVAQELGGRSRLGYAEWCTGMTYPVRTVIPFTGSTAAQSKLFACTSQAIYDVTTSSATPTAAHTFGDGTGDAGYGVATTVVTLGGHFCLYADEVNGLLKYDESAGTWAAIASGTGAGEISGVDPANVCFVMVWKNRVWMVEKDTATAWYLPTGTVAGVATPFYFGNKFRAGGHLVGLWNWTADGGTGIDDYLVALSSGGDVLVYQGTDPDSAVDFSMRGDWFVGALPAGRRVATDFGGELLLLTQVGILPLSKLLTGQAINPAVYSTRKIAPQIARLMEDRASLQGWSLRVSPKDSALIVTVPDASGEYTTQYAQSLNTGGWSVFDGLPMLSSEAWDGDLYFGSPDGIVYKATGGLDNVARDGTTTGATAVQVSGLTSFQSVGSVKRKKVETIRTHFRTEGAAPEYAVEARYDYDTADITATVQAIVAVGDVWDVGVWDTALWQPGGTKAYSEVRGATGIGSSIAIGYVFECRTQTTLIGFDIAVRECGMY